MRFLIAPIFDEELQKRTDHTPDCYVRPGEYLHHLYVEGVKYVVADALKRCIAQAREANDADALLHLELHQGQLDSLGGQQAIDQALAGGDEMIGDPPPPPIDEPDAPRARSFSGYAPQSPKLISETGLSVSFLFDMILRTIYNRGRLIGSDIADELKINFSVLNPILGLMRRQSLIDIVGTKGSGGDASMEYELKPPKGQDALQEALNKSAYCGPAPVPFDDYVESVVAQTVRNFAVTRRTIHTAFQDLIITPEVLNEIGPAINSASSIFLFGFPGNGKTAIAERITRLMGDDVYLPYAVEANGAIIQVFDPILHTRSASKSNDGIESSLLREISHDERYVRVRRPTIVVGGELVMAQLDLKYNPTGKYYEAPLQMKANGGIFMIDDFGRQQIRPMDLLNRWIVPLEKRYDYLTTITGTKIEIPFDQLLIFSTNLDPMQLADEAFLRRIKYKIEVRNPSEGQFRKIWALVCKSRQVECDERGIDYLIDKWYKPTGRPFRMCQPRDILDQMQSMAKYNMERVTFSPDLIDAACATYFVSGEKKDFGAKVRLE
ncbi:MAG: ATP-binding protein [Gemmataceae bacterium]|nr:ATP-binding protein [Gemmataceae bacterium]